MSELNKLITTEELYKLTDKYYEIRSNDRYLRSKRDNKEPDFAFKDDVGDFSNWLVFRNCLKKLGVPKSEYLNNFIRISIPKLISLLNIELPDK